VTNPSTATAEGRAIRGGTKLGSGGGNVRPLAASALEVKSVEWLWPGRIPLGLVTYLAGNPGLGKSLLSLRLVGQLTRGQLAGSPANALILSAEDAREQVVLPRLAAAGADLDRVFFPPLDEDGLERDHRLPDDIPWLRSYVEQVHARLVVIDPLVAHLAERTNSWQDQSVRTALAPLHRLAVETNSSILLIGHLNKGEGSDPLRRMGGSIGIPAAARSVLLLARDPDDPAGENGDRRVLAHVKSNVGPHSASVAYQVEPVTLASGVETARLVDQGRSLLTGTQLLADQTPGLKKQELAVSLLQTAVANGPSPVTELQRQAEDAGISASTLARAKHELGLESIKLGLTEGWAWTTPKQPSDGECRS
jgi:hypothetical protein